MNRPVKENLDPKLVENIVKIVSARFYVPKKIDRSSIPSNTPMRLNWMLNKLVPTREKLQTQSFKNVYQCYGNAFFDRQTVMNRTARNILELELVEDMVKIVSTQCNIPKKKFDRNSIPSNAPMRLNCTETGKSITNVTKGPTIMTTFIAVF
ncbi:unnamed protein product [Arctia plantaginis]|uniref:Uncharacterized protein n=1 Tax=Arctia plantaginis TaxID=874455 RepID=A0A8S0ZR50_ARCPL|nr:unnamed protein product [Arctia plantaginis]